ncbi:MAG TPA: dihydroorotase [Candidatus Ratteibacteria bacterium]|nr:dihydroorotase [Candidatus Ratteibacteria bacterium]
MEDILIKNGYIIDPASGKEGTTDILISNSYIKKISKNIKEKTKKVIDAKGKLVFPGLVDIHCHLREPGREDEETIISGGISAISGGFTTICCMPNTTPTLDNKVAIRFVYDRGKDACCEVLPIGAITVGREGKLIAPYGEMVEEGAVAFSDDGNCVMDSLVMRRALEYTKLYKKPIISHSEDENLKRGGVMNEGTLSTKMGLSGIPNQAEEIMVSRDIFLSNLTGGRLHLAHITTSNSVQLIKEGKKKNKNISCEVAIHHLILTEEAVRNYNPNAKVSPPLRTEKDRKALIAGLKDGTIDCIVTDHAPHSEEEKEMGFENSPFGIIGFETALSLSMKLTNEGLSLKEIIKKFTVGPAKVLGIDRGKIKEGSRADIVIFDPDYEWVYKKEEIKSKSKNSPFIGWKLKGKVILTISCGKIFTNF